MRQFFFFFFVKIQNADYERTFSTFGVTAEMLVVRPYALSSGRLLKVALQTVTAKRFVQSYVRK